MPIFDKLTNTTSSHNRFAFADGLRALAALWVVVFHLSEGHHVDHLRAALPDTINKVLFDFGSLGVAIFFVLSGFVMAYTVESKKADSKFSIKFIARRFLRLTPPYYFAILFAIAFLLIKKFATHEQVELPSANDFLMHLLYLQGCLGIHEINTIFWTLCIEVQFYITFIFLVFLSDFISNTFKINYARILIFSSIALAALPWVFNPDLPALWNGSFIKYWYGFMAGVLVCWAIKGLKLQKYFTFGYVLLISAVGLTAQYKFAFTVGITALMLLYAAQNNRMNTWLNCKWLQIVGLISYSLYLVHNPVTGATANILHRILPEGVFTDLVVTTTTLSASIAVAVLMYKFIEMPSIKLSHKATS